MDYPYDPAHVPPPFGLENSGVICYFNTLVQVLLSCPAFAHWLERYLARIKGGEEPICPDGPRIARLYLGLLRGAQEQYALSTNGCTTTLEAYQLFRCVVASNQELIRQGRQEDLLEGLMVFLASIDPEADLVFRVRHTCTIHCEACETSRVSGLSAGPVDRRAAQLERTVINPPNIFMDVCGEHFTRQEEVEEHLRQHRRYPREYQCENCRWRNGRMADTATDRVCQVYRLKRVSEVLILKLGDYYGKQERWFPTELSIPETDYHYRLVALVNHEGSRTGGHYYAHCLRPKPYHFHEARALRLAADLRSHRAGGRDTTRTEAALQDNARQLEGDPAPGVFQLNDSRVYYAAAGFRPGPYVLYAVYHLVP